MMDEKNFWVVGGEYIDTSFSKLANKGCRLAGPFSNEGDAFDAWRALSFATTASANVRFSIVEERPPEHSQ